MAVKSILIICRGNICRSPMAENFFRHQLTIQHSSVTISSAGITALVGHSADPHAETVMHKHGIDISQHKARQVSDDLIRKADLVFVMTQSQLNIVTRQFMVAKGKTFLLGHWRNFEIPDPYKQSYEMFEKCYQQIEFAWQDWKTRILPCQIFA